MTNDQQDTTTLEACYRRAAILQRAVGNMNSIAMNTTLVPHWIDDTEYFWYRRKTRAGTNFRLVNAEATTNLEAFDHQALARSLVEVTHKNIEANNLPIHKVQITLCPLQVRFFAFDKHYCFDADTQQCQAMAPESDVHSCERVVSPDGKKVAFTRDYNLWIQDFETGEELALTQDGEQYYAYASTRMLVDGSWTSDLQVRWSPDSKQLFTVQADCRQIKATPIIQHVPKDDHIRPEITKQRVAYPGDKHIEEQRILAINIETSTQQTANYRRVPLSPSGYGLFTDNLGWWGSNNRHAYFVDMQRGSKMVRVVEFDTYIGSTRILFEEVSETYLNLRPCLMSTATLLPLHESNELVWFSERTGWAHLYLYDLKTGQLKWPITQGNWMIREILHFDTKRRELWFQAGGRVTGRDPYYLDICRVNIDTGEITTLASSDHNYTVLGSRTLISLFNSPVDPDHPINTNGISSSARYIVTTLSRADQVPISILLNRNGEILLELETADISGLPVGWQWPEPVQLLAADGKTDIYGAVFRPSNFNPEQTYPVIDCSICMTVLASAPKGSFTNAISNGIWYLEAAALAELGFIVVTIDGRGTAFRDRAFVDTSYGWVPSCNHTEDRISGIKQLAERFPYMDLNRVGIMGFNGSVGAVYSLFQYPEFYKVGVSHASQDTRLMPAIYGELYEGLQPPANHHKYAEQLVVNFQGKLLLVHGQLDPMSSSAATWRLIHALKKSNKDFDMLILPNEGQPPHIFSNYAFRRTWDYFVKYLLCSEPPDEFDINSA